MTKESEQHSISMRTVYWYYTHFLEVGWDVLCVVGQDSWSISNVRQHLHLQITHTVKGVHVHTCSGINLVCQRIAYNTHQTNIFLSMCIYTHWSSTVYTTVGKSIERGCVVVP